MANEIRLRRNNIAGTITDNPLAIGATTINSANFTDLPVVDATNHMILVLDPLEVGGTAEVVRVTAHTAAAASVTVVRGQEGSVARSHVFNTTWFHGPVTTDWEEVLTSSTRPTVPYTGETLYETDTLRSMRYSGTAWAQDGLNWDPPACRIYHNVAQSAANGAFHVLSFNTERYDTDSMHDTAVNNSRITINTAGIYIVTAHVEITAAADYTDTLLGLRLNGSSTNVIAYQRDRDPGTANDTRILSVATTWKFAQNDFVETHFLQSNGAAAARNIVASLALEPYRAEMSACWIGRGN